jgi:hypothetical protein
MSQENIDSLRAYCSSWGMREDPGHGLLDPDVVFEDDILPDHAGETYAVAKASFVRFGRGYSRMSGSRSSWSR